jgi:hypothetical protein
MKPNQAATTAAVVFASGVTCLSSLAASQFQGTWKTKDIQGGPMEITLSADGIATGDHYGTAMNGTWKEEDDAAVISWTTGWTTKIIKQGDHYKKTAYKDRESGTEVAAEAEKVK